MSEESVLPVRERLIYAGMRELSQHGIQNFSIRRIAAACALSCAAPYRHFKDKQAFVTAIIEYINDLWGVQQRAIIEAHPGDLRRQIIEISKAYIRFLMDNPNFRSVIMLRDDSLDADYARLRGEMTQLTRDVIGRYCVEAGIDEKTRRRKTYVVRSLIYGAALLFDNQQLAYNEENMDSVEYAIDREFDLP
jgi:AcrR family transcriptional regulator